MRKGWRIKNDNVEPPALFPKAAQPSENVAINEVVRFAVEAIKREIAPAPFQIFFRKIDAGDAGPAFRRTDGKATGVCKRVQDDRLLRQHEIRRDITSEQTAAIITLIEE